MINMEYDYTFCKCSKCGRKILVERVLFGVSHTSHIQATCAECFKKSGLDPEFKKECPDISKSIEDWINDTN